MAELSSVATPQVHASTTLGDSPGADERWSAWIAGGIEHDRVVRRNMIIAAPILIVVAVLIYTLL